MASPKGFADWSPSNRKTAKSGKPMFQLVAEVQDTIERYRHEWPLTQRAWLYRLMSTYQWKKSWGDNLNTVLGRGRRARLIPFDAVISGRGTAIKFRSYDNARNMIDAVKIMPQYMNIDLQKYQERRVVLWKTEGYVPRLSQVAAEYGADVISGSGFDTLSDKYEFACQVASLEAVTILHFGDLDGSGEVMADEGLYADVRAFALDMGGDVRLDRIGLLDEHIDQFDLYSEPYIPDGSNHKFSGTRTAQAEALELNDAQALVHAAFRKHLDMELLGRMVEVQDAERAKALEILSKV